MNATLPFRTTYDAIVVGARCAGAGAAMLLARRGARVLLVERQPRGTDTLSTHALMRGAVLQLARWGLLDGVRRAGTPRVSQTAFVYGGERTVVPIRADGDVDGLYAPRRTVLDPLLVDAAWDAGAEVRHGVALDRLLIDDDGRVRGAVLRDSGGADHVVRSDLVIGADGLNSAVARHVGPALLLQGREASATVYGYVPDAGLDRYEWVYGRSGSVGRIPTNGDASCVFLSLSRPTFDGALRAGALRDFATLVGGFDPELGERVRIAGPVSLRVFGGRPGFLRYPCGPGWALAGDAAFFRDPITAHGITDALKHAEAVAEAAVDGRPEAWSAFAEELVSDAREIHAVTEAIASFAWTFEELAALHKRLSQLMKAEVAALADRPVRLPPANPIPEVA